jgi:hypothetical protein
MRPKYQVIVGLIWLLAVQDAAGQSITAGDCAAILANVRAGGNIVVNLKCDAPTERKILEALMGGKWRTECLYGSPLKWVRSYDGMNPNLTIFPGPGDYFSQYDFKFSSQPVAGGSPVLEVFVAGESLDWSSMSTRGKQLFPKALFTQINELRAKNPGFFVQEHVSDELHEMPRQEIKKVGKAAVRSMVKYEDGRDVVTESLDILEADESFSLGAMIFPFSDPYPRFGAGVRGHEFRCTADKSMRVDVFAALCKALIEKVTLSNRFLDALCAASPDGFKLVKR